jgi:hypothetical protein
VALQQQALDYWRRRRHHDGLRTIAAALGVAPWTLHRWTRSVEPRRRFRQIEVSEPAPVADVSSVVITLTAVGPRVEGLTVETAARR